MWRIETTLATLVITIIASSNMKLVKVSCPIDSENDRIRRTIAAKAMGCRDRLGAIRFYTPESAPRGTCPRVAGAGGPTPQMSHRADFEHLAVIAGLAWNAKLAAAVQFGHDGH